MPTADPRADASAIRDGEALRFSGALVRAQVASLWHALPPADGVRTLDLTGVDALDSAGLALLAEVAARTGQRPSVRVPAATAAAEGLSQLRAAYRLDDALQFHAA